MKSSKIARDGSRSDEEEQQLAQRALAGDRDAFDQLYDRYFARMAWQFRSLPETEAQAAIWETLEQLFAGLDSDELPLAERAFRIARATTCPHSADGRPDDGNDTVKSAVRRRARGADEI